MVAIRSVDMAKAIMFINSAGTVVWNRFSTVYFLSIGMSPSEVGALKSASLVCKSVAQPLWAATADIYKSPEKILAAGVAGGTVLLEMTRRVGSGSGVTAVPLYTFLALRCLRSAITATGGLLNAGRSSISLPPHCCLPSLSLSLSSLFALK